MLRVKEIVESSLKPLLHRAFYGWDINVMAVGNVLQVSVVSDEFYTTEKQQEAIRLIELAKERILRSAGSNYTSLHLSVRKSRSLFAMPEFDHVEGDEGGDCVNPNWPSKTGNPSGGGRGNNPPRR